MARNYAGLGMVDEALGFFLKLLRHGGQPAERQAAVLRELRLAVRSIYIIYICIYRRERERERGHTHKHTQEQHDTTRTAPQQHNTRHEQHHVT